MQTIRVFSKTTLRQWRSFSVCSALRQNQAEPQREPLTIPPPSSVDKSLSPKIEKLVGEISNLSLLEISELTGGLKKRLNLPDAPIMPLGLASVAPAEDEEVVQQAVKSSFTVKLMQFDEKQKVALIKEVKSLLQGMNLVQAKKFVEGAPTIVKADISKEEAEKLKEALTKVGGVIAID